MGYIEKIVTTLFDLDVDAVALVGDLVDGSVEQIGNRLTPLWKLTHRFRTYFVTGNHEYYYGDAKKWLDLYQIHRIRVLNNEYSTGDEMRWMVLELKSDGFSHTHAAQYYVLVPVISQVLPYFHGLYNLPYGDGKLFVSAGTLYQRALPRSANEDVENVGDLG
ncbi:unnamed protein product, partial [Strongylus vulgaris]